MDNTKDPQSTNNSSILLNILPGSLREKVKNNHNFVKTFNNISWLLADKFSQLIFGLLVGAWAARYLGPANYGELAYVIAIVGIFQIASQLGINNIAVRDLASVTDQNKEIVGTLFRLRICSGIFCFVCAVTVAYLLKTDTQSLLLAIIIAGGLIFQPSEVIDLWFQSNLQSKQTVLAKLITCLTSNTIKILLILTQMPLIAFALVVLFESIIYSIILIFLYRKKNILGYGHWNKNLCIKMISEGAPFLISGLLLVLYTQVDKVLIAKLSSITEAGYYTAAITLTSAINFLPIIICSSLAPFLAKLKNDNDINKFFKKLYSFLFWIAVFFSIALFFSAEAVIITLYGKDYLNSAFVVKLLALSVIPIFLSVSNDYLALSRKASKTTLIRTAIGLTINLTLNALLIPEYGSIGAAISILATHWISNTILYWIILKEAFFLQLQAIIFPLFATSKKSS